MNGRSVSDGNTAQGPFIMVSVAAAPFAARATTAVHSDTALNRAKHCRLQEQLPIQGQRALNRLVAWR